MSRRGRGLEPQALRSTRKTVIFGDRQQVRVTNAETEESVPDALVFPCSGGSASG